MILPSFSAPWVLYSPFLFLRGGMVLVVCKGTSHIYQLFFSFFLCVFVCAAVIHFTHTHTHKPHTKPPSSLQAAAVTAVQI